MLRGDTASGVSPSRINRRVINMLQIAGVHQIMLKVTVAEVNRSAARAIGGGQGGAGSNVAGLNARNFQTTVELRHGQTLAIAGLIQNNFGSQSRRVPFLGDIPYLGRLFSSDGDSYDEQELVVIVTPYLVSPLDEGMLPPLPGSDMFEPDDLEFYVRGSLVGHRAEDYRTPARTDIHKMHAFRRLEQKYILGQPGHSDGGRFLSDPHPGMPGRLPMATPPEILEGPTR